MGRETLASLRRHAAERRRAKPSGAVGAHRAVGADRCEESPVRERERRTAERATSTRVRRDVGTSPAEWETKRSGGRLREDRRGRCDGEGARREGLWESGVRGEEASLERLVGSGIWRREDGAARRKVRKSTEAQLGGSPRTRTRVEHRSNAVGARALGCGAAGEAPQKSRGVFVDDGECREVGVDSGARLAGVSSRRHSHRPRLSSGEADRVPMWTGVEKDHQRRSSGGARVRTTGRAGSSRGEGEDRSRKTAREGSVSERVGDLCGAVKASDGRSTAGEKGRGRAWKTRLPKAIYDHYTEGHVRARWSPLMKKCRQAKVVSEVMA